MSFRHALHHLWFWHRGTLITTFFAGTVNFLYFNFSPFRHGFLDAAVLILSLAQVFLGYAREEFSWKYLQSLPLTKRELYHFILVVPVVGFFPFFMWYLSTYKLSSGELLLSEGSTGIREAVVVYLSLSYLTSFGAFWALYEKTRAPYARKLRGGGHFLLKMRNVFVGSALVVTAFFGFLTLANTFPLVFNRIWDGASALANVWVGVLVVLALTYHYVFRRWLREELSYPRGRFRILRDVPVTFVAFFALTFSFEELGQKFFNSYADAPFHSAIFQGDEAAFRVHLGNAAELNRVHETGYSPIMLAAYRGREKMFKALLARGARLEGKLKLKPTDRRDGVDLLMLAVEGGNTEIVKLLITRENANASNGKLALLHLAAKNPAMVDLLLSYGADPNLPNHKNSTPLHVAADMRCFNCVVSLIEYGADPHRKNKHGLLPKDYASKKDLQLSYYLEKKSRAPANE